MMLKDNLAVYKNLGDTKLLIEERCKLAQNLWDQGDKNSCSTPSVHLVNPRQFVLEWLCELITQKKKYSLSEKDLIAVWDRFNFYINDLHDQSDGSARFNIPSTFVQVLVDSVSSKNQLVKSCSIKTCTRLLQTKYSIYFIKNFDQMTKLLNCFIDELNCKLQNSSLTKVDDQDLEATMSIFQKYFMCLKSQQNHNRLFNRLCSLVLFNLLTLIENLKYTLKASRSLSNELISLGWKILKFGLFSKSQANIYMEFFKNLPASFSNRSNYQVAILFTTIQSEAKKNAVQLGALCRNLDEMARELFAIALASSVEYKHRVQIIQFLVDLVWELRFPGAVENNEMEVDKDAAPSEVEMLCPPEEADVSQIFEALASLFGLFEELNIFKPIEDENQGGLFKNWCKSFLAKTFKCKFNTSYTNCLIKILRIDHHIMDPYLDTILKELQAEDNLEAFLTALLDSNVKFRQLSRITHKLVESLSKNEKLEFPNGFYKQYESCLENYQVDMQTILNIWQDVIKIIDQPVQIKSNLRSELCRLLNCILCRVNMSNPRLPAHIKTQSTTLLARTKSILVQYLMANYDRALPNDQLLTRYLEAFYSCGQLYLIIYRYSVRASRESDIITVAHSQESIANLNDFFFNLNDASKFNLSQKIAKQAEKSTDYRLLFQLQKLLLINLYAVNVLTESENENKFDVNVLNGIKSNVQAFFAHSKQLLAELSYSSLRKNDDALSKLVRSFGPETPIDSKANYAILHLKCILLDHSDIVLNIYKTGKSSGLVIDFEQMDFIKSVLYYTATLNCHESGQIDQVNSNNLFNNRCILSDVLKALVLILDNENDAGNKKQAHKFFATLSKFIEANFDHSLASELSESKKLAKFSLNQHQTAILLKTLEQLPIEYTLPEHAFLCFLIAQQLNLEASTETRLKFLKINLKIFSNHHFVELMTMIGDERLESWIVSLFDMFDQENGLIDESIVHSERGVFETLIKKSIGFLMRRGENSLDTLASLVGILLAKISGKQDESSGLGYVEMANQAFIYILRKSSNMNEKSHASKQKGASSEKDAESQKSVRKLNFLFDTLVEYFANLSKLASSADSQCDNQDNDFIICSVLLRRVSADDGTAASSLTAEKREFFKKLYEQCLKAHKTKLKHLKDGSVSEISQPHIEFIKSCISHAPKLAESKEVKISRVKVCQSLIDILLLVDWSKLEQVGNEKRAASQKTLNRDIVYSIGHLATDEFQQIVETVGQKLFFNPDYEKSADERSKFVKIFELIREVCSSMELLNEANKETFLHFVEQVLMVQIQPIFLALSSREDIKPLTSLLECQLAIASSKNVSLPSQTVISMFQIFALVSFANLELRECFLLQQIICKSISNLMMKYSKKFAKIAAVVCNLMIKLIAMTTNMCNQNYLKDDEDIDLAVQAVQDLDRVSAQLVDFKKDFSKSAPYMISEYVTRATLIPIHPVVKTTLSNAMYNLISICEIHGIAQLPVMLNVASKELFRTLYGEYEKYFKYTGKA